jgi:hypothetical protein
MPVLLGEHKKTTAHVAPPRPGGRRALTGMAVPYTNAQKTKSTSMWLENRKREEERAIAHG